MKNNTDWEEQKNKFCLKVDELFHQHLLNENKAFRQVFLQHLDILLQARDNQMNTELREKVEGMIIDVKARSIEIKGTGFINNASKRANWKNKNYNKALSDVLELLDTNKK